MATVREPARPPAARYDTVVQGELDRARRRIRILDLSAGALGFVALTLLYAFLIVLLDRRLDLSLAARQISLLGYGLFALAYLGVFLVWPLCRRINPYFAAREIEQVVPEAKNSLVNWLDLHDRPLPAAIHNSIGQRAAKDAGRADLEQAISGRRVVWLAVITGALFLGLFALLVALGGGELRTLLGRAFAPFAAGAQKRTRIEVVQPVNGDAVVAVGYPVGIQVRVEGRVPHPDEPDALRLLLRYQADEPYEEHFLEPVSADLWGTTVPPALVHNGFLYKVTGGDDETREYRIAVRAAPLITGFEATYHYRPYLGWPDETSRDANLKALRGTRVDLQVTTNRPVREGRLEMQSGEEKKTVTGEVPAGDPQALRFTFVLDRDGHYRVWFTTQDGDRNSEPMPYTITVLPDLPPRANLSKPGPDTTLPANGTLKVEGSASDDSGVTGLSLRMQQVNGPVLSPKVYREGKSFQLAGGGYPKTLDYKDFVDLEKVRDEQGRPLPLVPGMVLEYWLEAVDNCDYPGPNRGESAKWKVTITEPLKDTKKRDDERRQAAEEQKQHEASQDRKLDEENRERQKQGEQPGGAKQEGGQEKSPEEAKRDEELEKQAERIKQELDKRAEEEKKNESGDGKGESKGSGEPKSGEGKGENPQPKPDGKGDAKPNPAQGGEREGEGKDKGGMNGGAPPDTGDGKGKGRPQPDQAKGSGKSGNESGETAGGARPDSPPEPASEKGNARGAGEGDTQAAGQPKPKGAGEAGTGNEAAAKGPGQESGTAGEETAKGTGKGNPSAVARAESKSNGSSGNAAGENKTEGNPGAGGAADKAAGRGEGQDSGGDAVAKGEAKGDRSGSDRSASAGQGKPEEVARLEKDLQGTDGAKRDEAARKLEEMSRNAGDPRLRDAARQALEEERLAREAAPALPKSPPKEDALPTGGQPCAQCKGGGSSGAASAAAGKTGGGGAPGQGGMGSAAAKGGGKDGMGQGNAPAEAGLAKAPGQGGRLFGNGQGGRRGQESPPERTAAGLDPQHARAGVLQLEDFSKIDKNILKELGITEEEWQAFRKAYTEKRQRQAPETLPPTQGGSLSNLGSRQVQAPDKTSTDAKRTGLGGAPPEFRELFRRYTGSTPRK